MVAAVSKLKKGSSSRTREKGHDSCVYRLRALHPEKARALALWEVDRRLGLVEAEWDAHRERGRGVEFTAPAEAYVDLGEVMKVAKALKDEMDSTLDLIDAVETRLQKINNRKGKANAGGQLKPEAKTRGEGDEGDDEAESLAEELREAEEKYDKLERAHDELQRVIDLIVERVRYDGEFIERDGVGYVTLEAPYRIPADEDSEDVQILKLALACADTSPIASELSRAYTDALRSSYCELHPAECLLHPDEQAEVHRAVELAVNTLLELPRKFTPKGPTIRLRWMDDAEVWDRVYVLLKELQEKGQPVRDTYAQLNGKLALEHTSRLPQENWAILCGLCEHMIEDNVEVIVPNGERRQTQALKAILSQGELPL